MLVILNENRSRNYIAMATWGIFAGALTGYFLGYATAENFNYESTGFLELLDNHVPGPSDDVFHYFQSLFF